MAKTVDYKSYKILFFSFKSANVKIKVGNIEAIK